MPAKTPTKKQPDTSKQTQATAEKSHTNSALTPPSQNNDGLPDGWRWVKLGDLVDNPKQDLVDGPFGSNLKAGEYIKEGVPVFKIQNIKVNRFSDKKISFVSEAKAQSLIRHSFRAGDLIITKLGEPLGLCCKVPSNYPFGIIVADLMRLRPSKSKVYDQYLVYAINSEVVQNQFKTITKGTTRARVNLSIVREVLVAVPSLREQHSIVSKIEELLSELDKGKQQLETTQQQLKIYRQAVLKWAFEGRLNHDSFDAPDNHDENTQKNQGNQANQKNHSSDNLPKGWKWVRLGEISKVTGGLTKNAKRESLELRLPFLRVANVYFNFLDLTEMHTIGLNKNEVERVKLERDDLLFVEGNGSLDQIGRVALWNGAVKDCVHQNHLIKARLSKEVAPKYALYFFCSKLGRKKIKEQANSTSGLHTLSLGKISKLELPICSIEEQHHIVQQIESRLSVCDKVEETITTSLAQAETLRQSILKKAFEGKLV